MSAVAQEPRKGLPRLDTAARVARARELLESGKRTQVALRGLTDEFGVSTRAARNYVRRAFDQLAELEREQRPRRKIEMRLTLERLLASAEAAQDWKAAVQAADRLARMDGLFIDRIEMLVADTREGGQRPMTPAEQRRRLLELLTKDPTLLAEALKHASARQLEAPKPAEVEAEVVTADGA